MRLRASVFILLSTLSIVLPIAFNLTGCSAAARSAAYFEAHPAEAKAVLAHCKSGQTRGEECQTALAGAKAAADRTRLELYRKGF
ncbi:MAG: EexN family lipoprotein [Phenylobacterium sp.]